MPENQTQSQPQSLCERGHEFITVADGAQTEQRGPNTFALNQLCPACNKNFKRMAIRVADGLAYLPEHHTLAHVQAQSRPRTRTSSGTLDDGTPIAPQNTTSHIDALDANELLIQAVQAQADQNVKPSARKRARKPTAAATAE
jgi:hypothetical protein